MVVVSLCDAAESALSGMINVLPIKAPTVIAIIFKSVYNVCDVVNVLYSLCTSISRAEEQYSILGV